MSGAAAAGDHPKAADHQLGIGAMRGRCRLRLFPSVARVPESAWVGWEGFLECIERWLAEE